MLFTPTITAIEITNKEVDEFLQTPEKITPADTVFKLRTMIDKNQIEIPPHDKIIVVNTGKSVASDYY